LPLAQNVEVLAELRALLELDEFSLSLPGPTAPDDPLPNHLAEERDLPDTRRQPPGPSGVTQ
jgi:hypothetical protein